MRNSHTVISALVFGPKQVPWPNAKPRELFLWWERLNYPYRYQPCGQICSSASAERLLTRTLVLPHDWFPPTMGALLKFHSFTHHVAPMRMGTHSRVLGPLSQALPQTRKPGKWLSHEASRWRSTLWCGGSSSVRMLKQTPPNSSVHAEDSFQSKPANLK